MGGAVGHLYHLYDNPDLSFSEIKGILAAAAEGKLEKVSEKLDGMNLVFTWDESGPGLRVARNAGDIKSGGMDARSLAAKFADRGNLGDAFNSAFRVLNQSLGALPTEVRQKVFGPNGNVWYSMELIYSSNPNVIQYDGNNVVFHGWPVFKVNPDGSIEKGPGGGVDELVKYLDRMQSSVKEKDWRVRGPALVAMKRLSDGSALQKAESQIDRALSSVGASETDTVQEYLIQYVTKDAQAAGVYPTVLRAVVLRVVGVPGAPNLNDIKKKVPPEEVPKVQTYVKDGPKVLKRAIAPIEHAIHEFAVEVLRGLASTLISRSDAEVERLRSEVRRAAEAIRSSGNEQAMDMLQKQLTKLGSYENLAAAMEGVVFVYKGNAYKFTGAFAPVNQILGLFKYGRGKMKPMAQEKASLIGKIILEALGEGVSDEFRAQKKKAAGAVAAAQKALEDFDAEKKKEAAFVEKKKNLAAQMKVSLGNDRLRLVMRDLLAKEPDKYSFPTQTTRRPLEQALAQAKKNLAKLSVSMGFDDDVVKPVSKPEELKPAKKRRYYDINDPKNQNVWKYWPKDIKKRSGKGLGSRVSGGLTGKEKTGAGPGEEWLAWMFGATVSGGSTSYDLITQDPSTWEAKFIETPKGLISIMAEGQAGIVKVKEHLSNVVDQIKSFFKVVDKLGPSFFKGLDPETVRKIRSVRKFMTTDFIENFEKGELPRGRMLLLGDALEILKDLKSAHGSDPDQLIPANIAGKNIDLPKDIAAKVALETDNYSLFTPTELATAVLNDSAFRDPEKFIDDWYDNVDINAMFSSAQGGVIVTTPEQYLVIPKKDLAKSFRLIGLSRRGAPKIALVPALGGPSPGEISDED